MNGNWTFGRQIAVGFAIAALIVVVLAVVGLQSAQRLVENDRMLQHTLLVRRDLADLLSLLKDAETGQRGYVITGDDTFLEPYTKAVGKIDESFEEVRTLLGKNPEQARRLDELRGHMRAKLDELKATIELRRTAGFDATQKRVGAGDGKRAMDDVRRTLAAIDNEEQRNLDERRHESEASGRVAQSIMIWGGALGVLLVIVIGGAITRSLSARISTAVSQVQSSSAELQAAAQQQATGTREQATAMSQITTTINELLATSRQISDSSQRVAQLAERAAGSARSGDTTIERGTELVQGIRKQIETLVSQMLELGKKSQKIGTVLDIVAELAEQTNILAINATIEAAGAGDAGRRFSVVADEIRKLADRVTGSTKEIRGHIEDIRTAVNTNIMTTESGSKAADASARQFTDVASTFRQIAGLVSTTTDAAKEIELSTKQQATAVEQVHVAIASMAQTTKESEVSSAQTLQTARELTELSRALLEIIKPKAA